MKVEHECSKGHWFTAETERKTCPVYSKGKPCTGEVKRVGVGSRKRP
jgi:hypothetical protein